MITLAQAKRLTVGQTLYHKRYRNADGSPARYKVNGQPKKWVTRPNQVRVPLKHGLYVFGYLEEWNLNEFCLTEEEALYSDLPVCR